MQPARPDITALVADKYRAIPFLPGLPGQREPSGWIAKADFAAFRAAAEVLAEGRSLGICPGRHPQHNGTIVAGQAWHGPVAVRTGMPIVPVGIHGTEDGMKKISTFRRPKMWQNLVNYSEFHPSTVSSGKHKCNIGQTRSWFGSRHSFPKNITAFMPVIPTSGNSCCKAKGKDAMTADLNQPAPPFTLPDLDGRKHRLADWSGRLVILEFWSADCGSCERVDLGLRSLQTELGDQLTLVVIAAAPEPISLIRRVVERRKIPLVLRDGHQKVTGEYGVVVTPTLFILDREGVLRYRGAYDDRTFRKRESSRLYVIEAVRALLAGSQPALQETTAYGCVLMRVKS